MTAYRLQHPGRRRDRVPLVFLSVERMIVFTPCLMDADSRSFVASFFCSNQRVFVQFFFSAVSPSQSIRVNRRKAESEDSESFVTQKVLLRTQAGFLP